ncbi:MAG: hypothetical protein WC623_22115 [Pedobacter sp.]|uniref:hypothetical protein n=1 Tax=Pedobacter sp. TaxID=1411316 RepID=UPI003561D3A9
MHPYTKVEYRVIPDPRIDVSIVPFGYPTNVGIAMIMNPDMIPISYNGLFI